MGRIRGCPDPSAGDLHHLLHQSIACLQHLGRRDVPTVDQKTVNQDPLIREATRIFDPAKVSTEPGDTPTGCPVPDAFPIPIHWSLSVVRGVPHGEGNGKKSQARMKLTICWAGRCQFRRPPCGTVRPKYSRLLAADLGLGQVLDAGDARGRVGSIFAGSRHGETPGRNGPTRNYARRWRFVHSIRPVTVLYSLNSNAAHCCAVPDPAEGLIEHLAPLRLEAC